MKSRIRIGMVAALADEARTLGPARRLPDGLRALPDGSLLAVSGMGFEPAEQAGRALIDAGCEALVSWGLAGGLDPRLSPGTIVVPEISMLEGAPNLDTSSSWRIRALNSLSRVRNPVATGGRLLTSRRPMASAAEKRAAFIGTGAIAVDMESYAIASVAALHAFPFIAVRVIVDAANDEVPAAFLNAADPRGRLATGRLLARIFASPSALPALVGLAQRYKVARRSLAEAARAGAPGSMQSLEIAH